MRCEVLSAHIAEQRLVWSSWQTSAIRYREPRRRSTRRIHADHAAARVGVTWSRTCLQYFRGAAYSATAANPGTVGTNILAVLATMTCMQNELTANHVSRRTIGGQCRLRRRIARKPRAAAAMTARFATL